MATKQSSPLPEEQMEGLKAAFQLFDDNGDGEITVHELGAVMRQLGLKPSDTELEDLMNEIDTDRSGTISFEEFTTIMAHKLSPVDAETELRAAFDVFDKDGNGTISTEELRQLMKSIGEDLNDTEIEEMVREADRDGNGEIDYQEFAALMK
ncbi:uncharacterized protein KY384_004783 [Bacidia gigantensis]|uniref:uncharacterized protein n=1 Tax=Bacidia gigantensis TaxID=2732470 RepID=UPI001D048729|nr:uncharacterized protein KY384_004783 [Bacidia gigantensis]KAG8530281.1 hypothetical protein KY384_004783 [Bacidia gigantensis]